MSVEKLILKDNVGNSIEWCQQTEGFEFKIKDMNGIKNGYMTIEQAHLLMLYLQEHLKYLWVRSI